MEKGVGVNKLPSFPFQMFKYMYSLCKYTFKQIHMSGEKWFGHALFQFSKYNVVSWSGKWGTDDQKCLRNSVLRWCFSNQLLILLLTFTLWSLQEKFRRRTKPNRVSLPANKMLNNGWLHTYLCVSSSAGWNLRWFRGHLWSSNCKTCIQQSVYCWWLFNFYIQTKQLLVDSCSGCEEGEYLSHVCIWRQWTSPRLTAGVTVSARKKQ